MAKYRMPKFLKREILYKDFHHYCNYPSITAHTLQDNCYQFIQKKCIIAIISRVTGVAAFESY